VIDTVGLALSGGRMRLVAVRLGVLQALNHNRALRSFHYLSTVSAGRYIGCSLTANMTRSGGKFVFGATRNNAPAPESIKNRRSAQLVVKHLQLTAAEHTQLSGRSRGEQRTSQQGYPFRTDNFHHCSGHMCKVAVQTRTKRAKRCRRSAGSNGHNLYCPKTRRPSSAACHFGYRNRRSRFFRRFDTRDEYRAPRHHPKYNVCSALATPSYGLGRKTLE
jgi:hypothetical protein